MSFRSLDGNGNGTSRQGGRAGVKAPEVLTAVCTSYDPTHTTTTTRSRRLSYAGQSDPKALPRPLRSRTSPRSLSFCFLDALLRLTLPDTATNGALNLLCMLVTDMPGEASTSAEWCETVHVSLNPREWARSVTFRSLDDFYADVRRPSKGLAHVIGASGHVGQIQGGPKSGPHGESSYCERSFDNYVPLPVEVPLSPCPSRRVSFALRLRRVPRISRRKGRNKRKKG